MRKGILFLLTACLIAFFSSGCKSSVEGPTDPKDILIQVEYEEVGQVLHEDGGVQLNVQNSTGGGYTYNPKKDGGRKYSCTINATRCNMQSNFSNGQLVRKSYHVIDVSNGRISHPGYSEVGEIIRINGVQFNPLEAISGASKIQYIALYLDESGNTYDASLY